MIGRWAQRFATAIERPFAAYGFVLGGVAIAVVLRAAAGLVIPEPPPFMTFFPAILFATLVAGARGGLAAVALSLAAVLGLFMPLALPSPTWEMQHTQLVMFTLTGLLMVFMAKALRMGILHGVTAEERFRAAQEGGLDAFVILEPLRQDGRIVDFRWIYANPAADRTAPAAVSTLTGRRVLEVMPDESGQDLVARLIEAMKHAGPDDIEVRRVIDGVEHWMRSSAVRLKNGVAVTYRDVTSQRAAQQALRDGEAQVRVLINSLPQLLWSSRPEGYCDYFGPQWTRYTGLPPERLFGKGWLEVVHPEDRDNVEQAWTQLIAGSLPYDLEYRMRRKDGSWRWFSGRASMVRDETGAIRRWYGSATDITETIEARRHLEERVVERTRELRESLDQQAVAKASLAQAQRLETVGRLTGGVAHDFNNLLTVVIGGLDMILKAPEDSARVKRLGEAALAAGRRGERLTRQLLAFSRRQELKLEVRDVSAIVGQAEALMRRAAGEALELSVACAADVGFSKLDTAQLESALLNLVVNAADATPAGGHIRIEADRVRLAAGEVAGAEAGEYVRIAVADNGSGMPSDVLERVFEPFFTTKEIGKGTGLGLAQVYGFVSQCGGGVAIDSHQGQGTTVKLYLPSAPQPQAGAPSPPARAEITWAAGTKVLLVEDDAAVRAVTETLLEDMGCEVASEAEGAPALRRLERGESFDIVISDIIMPGGMSGVDLARAAHVARPGLRFVLTTGYAGERGGAAGGELDWPVLRKPFRAEQLAAVLHESVAPAAEAAV